MGDIEEARRQISALPNVLNGDYFLTLKYNTSLKEAKHCFPEILMQLITVIFSEMSTWTTHPPHHVVIA